jgi:hypothetical protein
VWWSTPRVGNMFRSTHMTELAEQATDDVDAQMPVWFR